jgi:hypothetical protein
MPNHPYVQAMLAGLLFGCWPLLMNRSGLSGNMASFMFVAGCLLIVTPFALATNGLALPSANWTTVIAACTCAGIATLVFNSALAKVTPATAGTVMLLMVLPQLVVPAVYEAILTQSVPVSRAVGLVAAIIAAVLLV